MEKLSEQQAQEIRVRIDSAIEPVLREWCKKTGLQIDICNVEYDFSCSEGSGLSFTLEHYINIEKLLDSCIETYPKEWGQSYKTDKSYEVIKNKYHFIIERDSWYKSHQYSVSCKYWCKEADYTEDAEELAFYLSNDINGVKNIICNELLDVVIATAGTIAEELGYSSIEKLGYEMLEAEGLIECLD